MNLSSRLECLQGWLQAIIVDPENPARPLERDEGQVRPEEVIRSSTQMPARARLEVYREGYVRRLIECLADDYPVLQFALGDEPFAELCRQYVDVYPSRSPTLNVFGRRMAAYCASLSGWELGAFASDLAVLEWSLVEVLHTRTAAPITAEALAHFAGGLFADARLVANPSCRLVGTRFPVNRFFQAFQEGERPSIPSERPSTVAVVRKDYTIIRKDVGEIEAVALGRLLSGASIGEALGAASRAGPLDDSTVSAWFQSWCATGMFVSIEPH